MLIDCSRLNEWAEIQSIGFSRIQSFDSELISAIWNSNAIVEPYLNTQRMWNALQFAGLLWLQLVNILRKCQTKQIVSYRFVVVKGVYG